MSIVTPSSMPQPRRWTRDEIYRIADMGLFTPEERWELVNGELLEQMPENPPHITAHKLTNDALVRAFAGQNVHAHSAHPVVLSAHSEPVPDVAIVRGMPRQYATRRVTSADVVLIVEVSDSTLEYDRTTKRDLYAAAGITEYWIVNVRERQLEVFRAPVEGAYTDAFTIAEDSTIAPVAAPQSLVSVADLLP